MDTVFKFGVGLVAVVALVLGVMSLTHPVQTPPVGATAGANDQYPCKNSNGVGVCKSIMALTLSTTTPCAIKSPAATSTLMQFALRISAGPIVAVTPTLASATNAFATTTAIGNSLPSIAAGAQATMIASTTVLAPSTWIVVGFAGGSAANISSTGFCQATFETVGYPNFNY